MVFEMINFVGFSAVLIFVMFLGLVMLGVWLWALIDCLVSKRTAAEKLLWVIIILIFNLIGAILYLLLADRVSDNFDSKNSLTRSQDDKIIAGVCGGLGEYLSVDSTIVRLLWVLFTIVSTGAGILIYIVAALIMPLKGKVNVKGKNGRGARKNKTWVLLVLLLVFFVFVNLLIFGLFIVSQHSTGVYISEELVSGESLIDKSNYRGGIVVAGGERVPKKIFEVTKPTVECREIFNNSDYISARQEFYKKSEHIKQLKHDYSNSEDNFERAKLKKKLNNAYEEYKNSRKELMEISEKICLR